jgi:hypothetical protein
MLFSDGAFITCFLSVGSCLIALSGLSEYWMSKAKKVHYQSVLVFSLLMLFLFPIILWLICTLLEVDLPILLSLTPLYSIVYSLVEMGSSLFGEEQLQELYSTLPFQSHFLLISLITGWGIGVFGYIKAFQSRQALIDTPSP